MKHLLHVILTIILTAAITSCRDTSDPGAVDVTAYDIVCLRATGDDGSTFTLTLPDDDELITYTARQRIDTARVKPGERLLLAYLPAGNTPYKSGEITVKGYGQVYNDRLRIGHIADMDGWDRDPVYLLSAWMSENYLNLRARLTYDTEPRTLMVMIDSVTIDRERPVCYLVHRMAKPTVNFDRNTYVSIDMSALRRLDYCRGFELRLNDSNMPARSITFDLKDIKD